MAYLVGVVAWCNFNPSFPCIANILASTCVFRGHTHIKPRPHIKSRPPQGLSNDQVHFRQRRDGPNVITPPRQLPEFLKFLKNLVGGFALLLWAAAIMSLVAYGIQQATVDGGDQSNVSGTSPYRKVYSLCIFDGIHCVSLMVFHMEALMD